jgi:hypothetical protein
MIGIQHIFML